MFRRFPVHVRRFSRSFFAFTFHLRVSSSRSSFSRSRLSVVSDGSRSFVSFMLTGYCTCMEASSTAMERDLENFLNSTGAHKNTLNVLENENVLFLSIFKALREEHFGRLPPKMSVGQHVLLLKAQEEILCGEDDQCPTVPQKVTITIIIMLLYYEHCVDTFTLICIQVVIITQCATQYRLLNRSLIYFMQCIY